MPACWFGTTSGENADRGEPFIPQSAIRNPHSHRRYSVATNTLPKAVDALFTLAVDMADGLHAQGNRIKSCWADSGPERTK